jgi:crotonobetainyl-CoA:carnitine CoA-transferase CaiB-like acyl-CoA transferase
MVQVLKDIKVVEHGTFITGPFAGMMLADLGASIIDADAISRDLTAAGGAAMPAVQVSGPRTMRITRESSDRNP